MKSKELKIEEGNYAVVEPQIMQYPLTYFKQKLSKETYEMIDWHWHSGVQFCYVTLGEVKIQIAGNEVILEEGEGLFINAQQVHKAINQKENAEYISLNLPIHFMGLEGSEMYHQFMEPVLHAKGAEIIVIRKNDEKMQGLLAKLQSCIEKINSEGEIYSLNLLAELLLLWDELLHEITVGNKTNQKESGINKRLQEILRYLQENYQKKISLQQIADQINLSKSECARFFKKITGETIFEYLLKLRIEKSIELLENTDKTITEIAYETGFASQSYYDQRFRKMKGIAPLKYRKKSRSNMDDISLRGPEQYI